MFSVDDYEQNVGSYLEEIGGIKPLKKKEEKKLWERLKNDPNDILAKDKLITSNLKFVVSVANHYRGLGLPLSDLIAEGNVGLMKAYTRFDPSKDVKFISYSVHWIKQTIMEAIEKRKCITGEQLPKDYETNNLDIDTDYKVEDQCLLAKDFIEEKYDDAEEIQTTQNEILRQLLTNLDKRELHIIKEYYGLYDGISKTLDEIGISLGLTKERVRQIKENGMKKLRSYAIGNPRLYNIYSELGLER